MLELEPHPQLADDLPAHDVAEDVLQDLLVEQVGDLAATVTSRSPRHL